VIDFPEYANRRIGNGYFNTFKTDSGLIPCNDLLMQLPE
jgi:hypothetical protein